MKQMLNKKMLREMVPLSPRAIDAMERRGDFPRRFALPCRVVVWDKDEVEAWMDQQKEARRQVARP